MAQMPYLDMFSDISDDEEFCRATQLLESSILPVGERSLLNEKDLSLDEMNSFAAKSDQFQ